MKKSLLGGKMTSEENCRQAWWLGVQSLGPTQAEEERTGFWELSSPLRVCTVTRRHPLPPTTEVSGCKHWKSFPSAHSSPPGSPRLTPCLHLSALCNPFPSLFNSSDQKPGLLPFWHGHLLHTFSLPPWRTCEFPHSLPGNNMSGPCNIRN